MTPVSDDDALRRVDVAILVALSLEATPLVEKLHDVVNLTAAAGLKITVGQLKERRVAVVTTGVGREAAVRGTQMTIAGHRPQLILAAGLCGGLAPDLRRGEVVIGQFVTRASGGSLTPIRTQGVLTTDGMRQVRVVTADSVVETPEGKRQLRAATDGDVVDMESWWIAEAAEATDTAWAVVRSISDTAEDRIPKDVAHLASVKHPARLAGAAARLLFFRPSAIGDLAELREHACAAADRLAAAVEIMLGRR